jgi:hypothetical protein
MDFEAYTFKGGEATKLVRGNLQQAGALQFIQDFICRTADDVPQHQSQLEDALTLLSDPSANDEGAASVIRKRVAIVEGGGLLGSGGSSKVFKVTVEPELLAKVFKVPVACEFFALKIVSDGLIGEREWENLTHSGMQSLCQRGLVPQAIFHCTLKDRGVAILLSPVGRRIDETEECKYLPELFVTLSRLHQAGWHHGDARLPNFVLCEIGEKKRGQNHTVIPVDFAHSRYSSQCSPYEAESDIYRLIASFLRLSGSNMLTTDSKALVSTKNFPNLSVKVQSYLNSGYGEAEATSLGRLVSTLK